MAKVKVRTGLSVEQLRKRLKNNNKGKGGGGNLLLLRDGDEAHIRFLEPVEKMFEYGEHYVRSGKSGRYIPCIGEDDGCEHCEDGYPANRAIINVWVYYVRRSDDKTQKTKTEKVNGVRLLKLTGQMQSDLVNRSAKRGTIADRELDLSRTGADQDTTYTFDFDDAKSKVPSAFKKEMLIDKQKYLDGLLSDDDESDRKKKKGSNKKKRKDDDDEDDFDVEDFEDDEDDDDEDFD